MYRIFIRVQCAVCSVQCVVCSGQCAVCSVQMYVLHKPCTTKNCTIFKYFENRTRKYK